MKPQKKNNKRHRKPANINSYCRKKISASNKGFWFHFTRPQLQDPRNGPLQENLSEYDCE